MRLLLPHSLLGGTALNATQMHKYAASEDRTHDLRIMRPTRYQLRYRRFCKRHALLNAEARLLRVTPARCARTGTQRCAASRRRATHIVILCSGCATNVVKKAIRHRGDSSECGHARPEHDDSVAYALRRMGLPLGRNQNRGTAAVWLPHFQQAECRSG